MSNMRERNPRGHGDQLRDDLLNAAVDLLARHGSAGEVSLRAVAKAAGVTPPAVYRHFADYEALQRAAVTHCWEEFRTALVASTDVASSPIDNFRAMGLAYLTFGRDHKGKYRVLFSNRIPLDNSEATSASDSAMALLIDQVAALLAANDDDRDPEFVAFQVHTWVHGAVDLMNSHADYDWPTIETLLDEVGIRLDLLPR